MNVIISRLAVSLALAASMLVVAATPASAANPEFSETADATWMTNGVGRVKALAAGGNRMFVGGSFTAMRATYNGSNVNQKYVAALDMWTGDLLAGFDPVLNDEVRAIAVSPNGQTVYVGGRFTQVNGQSRTKVAALDVANGNLRAFDVVIPNGNVEALEVDSAGNLYIGGSFNIVNNDGQRALAKVNGVTGALMSWDANVTVGKVMSLQLNDDESRLYIGTSINDENQEPRFGDLLAVNPANANPIAGFNASGVNRPVLDIGFTDDKIYLAMGGGGGAADVLRESNGSRRVRFNTDGDVQSVQVVGDRAYFGGHWVENFGSASSFRFTSVRTDNDQVDGSYYPTLNGAGGIIDMEHDGFHLWMGGHVIDGNPVRRRGFARYSPVSGGPVTPLIDDGARWRYLDDGSQLGTGWRKRTFNDDSWKSGRAELGYGDGDEETVVNDGPNNNRFITTYFRRTVTVYDVGDIGYLEFRLKRDDGVVVYINNKEVIRDNLPTGTITGSTRALTAINGSAEDTWTRWFVPPSFLSAGDNVVAVEIHQVSPSSNDITFDLQMLVDTKPKTFIATGAKWRYNDNGSNLGTAWRRLLYDDDAWGEGRAQLGYGEGDERTVIDSGPSGDRHITSYFRRIFTVYDLNAVNTLELDLKRDDGAVVYLNDVEVARSNMPSGPITSETTALKLSAQPGEQNWYRYSINPSLLRRGDNILAVEIHQKGPYSGDHSFDARLSLQASPEQMLKRNLNWRYSDIGVPRGTAWRQIDFPYHTNWERSSAELGYGDGDEATVIESGPPGNHYPTAYFRRLFIVEDPDVFNVLDIGLIRDDGAVIYVNGVEVLRENMPSGPINFYTLAAGGASGESDWHYFSVPASALVKGLNVIAVEMHQSGPGSSDMSFNLELTGR